MSFEKEKVVLLLQCAISIKEVKENENRNKTVKKQSLQTET